MIQNNIYEICTLSDIQQLQNTGIDNCQCMPKNIFIYSSFHDYIFLLGATGNSKASKAWVMK